MLYLILNKPTFFKGLKTVFNIFTVCCRRLRLGFLEFFHFFPSGDLKIKLFTGHPVSFDGNNTMYLVSMKKGRTNGSIVDGVQGVGRSTIGAVLDETTLTLKNLMEQVMVLKLSMLFLRR